MSHLFESFFIGGFEASSHRRPDHKQLDLIEGTRHFEYVAEDYRLLASVGIRTVRDGLRWHLIERAPHQYDWHSFLPMVRAARECSMQVIWDLCHWGLPHDIDIFSSAFVDRFAAFARAAAQLIRDETDAVPFYSPVNEISFWSWIGGDRRAFYPYKKGSGGRFKQQLVLASIAAIEAVRSVDTRARFVQPEPIIHIIPNPKIPNDDVKIAQYVLAQYESWDMLTGRLHPELGGAPQYLDIVGMNYYWNNQWMHKGYQLPLGHPEHRPLEWMLADVYARYGRPLFISETGAEGVSNAGWLRYVSGAVRGALQDGVPLEGLCLYPVMDYPGWEDNRHCECGLIEADRTWDEHRLRPVMVNQLKEEQASIARVLDGVSDRPSDQLSRNERLVLA